MTSRDLQFFNPLTKTLSSKRIFSQTWGRCPSNNNLGCHSVVFNCQGIYLQDASMWFSWWQFHTGVWSHGMSKFGHVGYLMAFSVTVQRYRWPQTQVIQELGKLEAYVCASFGSYLGHIKDILSLPCVCGMPYAARRNGISFHTYVILLDIRLRTISGRDILFGRVMWLGRISAVLRSLMLAVPRHCLSSM